jgi:hypothetical protein
MQDHLVDETTVPVLVVFFVDTDSMVEVWANAPVPTLSESTHTAILDRSDILEAPPLRSLAPGRPKSARSGDRTVLTPLRIAAEIALMAWVNGHPVQKVSEGAVRAVWPIHQACSGTPGVKAATAGPPTSGPRLMRE